jgi:hypothetical protein
MQDTIAYHQPVRSRGQSGDTGHHVSHLLIAVIATQPMQAGIITPDGGRLPADRHDRTAPCRQPVCHQRLTYTAPGSNHHDALVHVHLLFAVSVMPFSITSFFPC